MSVGIHNEVLWIHYPKPIDVKAIDILELVCVYQKVHEDSGSNSIKCKLMAGDNVWGRKESCFIEKQQHTSYLHLVLRIRCRHQTV